MMISGRVNAGIARAASGHSKYLSLLARMKNSETTGILTPVTEAKSRYTVLAPTSFHQPMENEQFILTSRQAMATTAFDAKNFVESEISANKVTPKSLEKLTFVPTCGVPRQCHLHLMLLANSLSN